MNLPDFYLQELKGETDQSYAVSVSGHLRVTSRLEDGTAVDADYLGYHQGGFL